MSKVTNTTKVGPAVAIKMVMPEPKNVVVCLAVYGDAMHAMANLTSEPMSKADADAAVIAINKALEGGRA